MITHLHIENFKSLVDFDLPPNGLALGRFTCLIGLNGSGKTTLLQAFEFLGQLALGKMQEWLDTREWRKNDLTCRIGKSSPLIHFRVSFQAPNDEIFWEGKFNTTHLRCTSERITTASGFTLLELVEGKLEVAAASPDDTQRWDRLDFVMTGSVLSFLKLTDAHPALVWLKETLEQLKSLELLSPHLLRRRARGGQDIGIGGEKLAPFLDRLQFLEGWDLEEQLREFYPRLIDLHVKGHRAGWKEVLISEKTGAGAEHLWTRAAHLNDGMLRVLAILSQTYSKHRILLFDEIENGMNPELIGKIVSFLLSLDRQVIVTTHSPLILNYLPDEVAKESLILLYKPLDGATRCVRFFDIPEMQKKLAVLGPGEVFADTNLTELVEHLPGGNGGLPQ